MLARGAFSAAASSAAPFPILKVGANCCGIARAQRAAVIADAADYFRHLEAALRCARRSIIIIGWDFDGDIRLRIDGEETLGALLRALVEEHAALEVRILIWNLSTLYAPGAVAPMLLGAAWQDHARINVRLDNSHPVYGAQHQKIISIDGSLAFVGGIDLTVGRWDTSDHTPDDPRRVNPDGNPYEPVHDTHMAVEGEAARIVARIARDRWRIATGEDIPACPPGDAWPPKLEPDFRDTPVAVACTAPRWGRARGIREIAALHLDALATARRAIYIEAQYFADGGIGDVLVRKLGEADGPEVVVLVTQFAHGFVEKHIMGGNRDRMLRRLKKADRFNRFRAFYPVIARPEGDCQIFIHSKVMIVDDRFLEVGSANLNRRSIGLDTECDLAIEAADTETRRQIAEVRARFAAEHLGVTPEAVATTLQETQSLIAAIERLNRNPRRLRGYSDISLKGPTRLMFGTRILDPKRPFPLLSLFRRRRSS
jgi:phosphatidylserine/phosphatidylglycerophosphate/cardiolipin synthase-like enzyme